jgi:uncharacterized repeat protein (TIGR03803 family)
MTFDGGLNGYGNVFSIDSTGLNFKDIFDFNSVNGEYPNGDLTLSGSIMYGMTLYGGANADGNIFSMDTSGGSFTDLFDFNFSNGAYPQGSLTLVGGSLYGLTNQGGAYSYGNLFSIKANGNNFADLYDFDGNYGENPYGTLAVYSNIFYGMAYNGGTQNYGVIFRFIDGDIATGLNKIAAGMIRVYPNPSNGIFIIAFSHAELVSGSQTIEVFNVLGEKVYTLPQTPKGALNTINLSGQPSGVYLYRVVAEDGSLVGEGKLIIQK